MDIRIKRLNKMHRELINLMKSGEINLDEFRLRKEKIYDIIETIQGFRPRG